MDLKSQLQTLITGDIIDDSAQLSAYSRDASIFEITPQIVIAPKDVEDIKKLVLFAKEKKISLTPRSAGTDMSGGPLNEGIVLDMTKYFNQVKEVGEGYAITQPGVYYRDFEKLTLEKGWLLPCYTASREICTVGGMVANNSAGEKTLSYGQTERYVKRLKIVLADGEEYEITPLSMNQLTELKNQNNFLGQIYQEVLGLIEMNREKINTAKPTTSKNAAGYYLWNVLTKDSFNLNKLLVGSQGTLGIITEIEFELVRPQPFSTTLILELDSLDQLDQIINKALEFKPESFECFDDQTLSYSLKFLPELIKGFKQTSGLRARFVFLKEILESWFGRLPQLVLLAEFTGITAEEVHQKAQLAFAGLAPLAKTIRMVSVEEAEKYWTMRRQSFALLKNHSVNMRTAPFIDDFVIKPESLPQFLPRLKMILNQYKKYMLYTIAGHIGDGNFHIIPLMDFRQPGIDQIIRKMSDEVFELVFQFKGSMSAEHNDGLVRGPYLEMMYGKEMVELFKRVKKIFDSENIFNPHKKSDATFDYSYTHITHEQQLPHGS